MPFSPESGNHDEFVQTSQTVSVENPDGLEFQITDVSYSHPYGFIINDMKISNDETSFTYATAYDMVVNRACDYVLKPSELELTYHHIPNIQDLPKEYEAVYCVENPPPSIDITFTVHGRERKVSTSTDSASGSSSTTYGPWHDQTYTWTDTVSTNLTKQMELVAKAVQNSQAYKFYTEHSKDP